MEDFGTLNHTELYNQFKREKQYLDNVSAATVEGYGWAWKAFESAFKSGRAVTKADVVAHIAALRERGLTPVTINTYLRSLNTFFHWLKTEGHCGTLLKIPRLKEDKKIVASFDDAQVQRLLGFRPKGAAEYRMHLIVCLILDTGSRIDEVLSVERKDLDLDNMLLKIRHGKGSKERIVPISLQMRKLLFRHAQRGQPEQGDLLFFSGVGHKLSQRNALRVFKRICERAGIDGPRCSFHTLRHTFGKNYIRNGGDVFRLQKILGHAKLEMTRRYVNLETSDLQRTHHEFSTLARQMR